jgi:hypothetical protein
MATYNPPAFPRRPKVSTVFSELQYRLQLSYYRYQINTALYVMSPGEKCAYNIIFATILVLFFSAIYYLIPRAAFIAVYRLLAQSTDLREIHIAGKIGAEVLRNSREAVASLADAGGMVNASSAFEL